MSRAGRPSERTKREPPKRNLIGPHELLERIKKAGGVPAEAIEEFRRTPASSAAAKANEQIADLTEKVAKSAASIEPDAQRVALGDDPDRRTAWLLSILTSLKESVPRRNWCRHLRAADPNVTEIRSVAVLSSGIWKCVECLKQGGEAQLGVNLWPNECDLCGAESAEFNEIAGNIPGCMVTINACPGCAEFLQPVA